MKTAARILAVTIAVSLLLTGPLAPPALAQQPAQPAQPDLFKETVKPAQAAARTGAVYHAEAVVANLFLVPGRVVTCAMGGAVGLAVLGLTLGSGYRAFSAILHEGCGGKWVVTGEDLRPQPPEARPFDWEQR